ncbi:MAG: RNA polymerase sporulation sigma factor SigK [Lachnospiraceae bacterium]|nr:RNA polymerase sporulation sigma factor SigK [Lachnospiraceae bacterium]
MKTFPQPLTAKEEKRYLEEFRKGNQAAKDILIERNMRLVAHMVKKYTTTERDVEDLISVGSIGLIKAVHTFDPAKGSRLGTYAARCIDNEILMLLRSRKKQSREVSMQEPVGIDKEGNEITLLDLLESDELSIELMYARKEDIYRMANAFRKCLSDKEKTVIRMRYGLDGSKETTQREIAEELGISRSYVSRIEKGALEKMRKEMEAET